ncbi:LADA_0H12222g1_1 [Lachancea dasiensis]|uniref:LADA_0H12222g1_1 n=1 Tax=Lachancea dasiensis TaxID=1072105 RepID=A0A1G4K404_9SACH|nr:LADA_0H12222g1_1 [Lachancea dasiensis]
MKFSQVALVSAAAVSTTLAAPAVTTVTHHAHAQQTAVVKGSLYTENGVVKTSWTTELENAIATSTPATVVSATSSSAAVASSVPASTVSAPASSSDYSIASTVSAPASSSDYLIASTVVPEATTSSSASSSSSSTFSSAPATSVSVAQKVAAQSVAPVSTSSSETSSSSTTTLSPSSESASASSTETSTSSSSSATASSTSSSSDFESSMLKAHNDKRALHEDTSDLSWSDTLASYAQDYADKYDCSGSLTHSGGPYGENLACGYSGAGSVEAWYDEIKSYDWSNPTFSESTGHFTQVVWKSTSQVGCGIKKCGGGTGDYVICSYKSAGNFLGEFADNVMSTK